MRFWQQAFVYLLFICLPSMGFALSCKAVYPDPHITAKYKTLVEQYERGEDIIKTPGYLEQLNMATKALLRANGVSWNEANLENGNIMLEILPGQNSDLNKLAFEIQSAYDGHLFVWPAKIIEQPNRLSFVSTVTKSSGKTAPFLSIGLRSLLGEQRLLRNINILHELRHMRQMANLKNRIESPFYGSITALKGKVPDPNNPDFEAYSTYLSFDEILTYRAESRQHILSLKKSLRGSDQKEINLQTSTLASSLTYLYLVSSRSKHASVFLRDYISKHIDKIVFSEDRGIVIATIRDVKHLDSVLEFEIPLVNTLSTDSNAKKVRDLLSQVDSLKTSTIRASEKAIAAHQKFSSIKDTVLKNKKVSIAVISEIISILSPPRSEKEPIELERY